MNILLKTETVSVFTVAGYNSTNFLMERSLCSVPLGIVLRYKLLSNVHQELLIELLQMQITVWSFQNKFTSKKSNTAGCYFNEMVERKRKKNVS